MSSQEINPTINIVQQRMYICRSAEPRMKEAVSENGIILVNQSLLLKMKGVFSAVSLYETPAQNGKISAGRWYFPRGEAIRNEIREAFYDGESAINLPTSTWSSLRRLRSVSGSPSWLPKSSQPFLENLREAAEALPYQKRTTTREERIIYHDHEYEGDDWL